MKKELVISAKFDTSDFDKTIDSLQKKLKEIYAPADAIRAQASLHKNLNNAGFGGIVSNPGQDAFSKATQQSRRELDALIREQATGQERLGKMLAQRVDKLKELKKQQSDLVKDSERELALKEKIARIEENNIRLKDMYQSRASSVNNLLEAKMNANGTGIGGIVNAYRHGGGFSGAASQAMQQAGGPAGMIGGALGGIGGAMQVGGALYRDYTRIPMNTAQAQGGATANTVGRDLQNVYSGRTAFDSVFMGERQRALSKSMEAYKGGRVADILGTGGMAAGAIGAGIGAFAGGPVGAGVIGGVAAAGTGLYNIATNQRSRDAALSMFSDRYKGRYDATRAEDFSKDFRSTYEAEQNRDPIKKLAAGEFEQNMMRNLQAQRSMGLTNSQFTGDGGYLNRTTNAGFTHDQGIGMSGAIMGAGGSSRMARDSSFGLQMERMGVTNAGSVLGSLSGSIQSPESTKRATIAIMSEAMQIGLDQSEFSEENRRFTAAAANIIARTGATGGEDQDRIAAMLGQFVGDKTNAGISAAGGAYESFQQRGSQLGGRRGTLRMVEAMKDPTLSKLGQNDLSELLGIRPEDMNENNAEVNSMARDAGVSAKDLIGSVNKVNRAGRFELPGQLEKVNTLKQKVKAKMASTGKSWQELAAEGDADIGKLQIEQRRTESEPYNRFKANSGLGEELGGGADTFGPTSKEAIAGLMGTASRREDKFIQGAAGDSEVVRKNFNDMSGEMDKAADAASKMTIAVRQMAIEFADALAKAERDKNAAPLDALLQKYGSMGTQTQVQSGKGRK